MYGRASFNLLRKKCYYLGMGSTKIDEEPKLSTNLQYGFHRTLTYIVFYL